MESPARPTKAHKKSKPTREKHAKTDPSSTSVAQTDPEPESADLKTTTTVFVSNLPTSIDSASLLERASSIGPVRAAFVVSDPSTSQSRGFGYVRFVLREDAETALKDGLGQFEGQNKAVLLTWAKPKLNPDARLEMQQQRASAKLKRPRPPPSTQVPTDTAGLTKKKNPLARTKKDMSANRTVVVQGLPIPKEKGRNPDSKDQASDKEDDDGSDKEDEGVRTDADGNLRESQKPVTTKALYKRAKKLGKLESIDYPIHFPKSASSACAHFIFADPTSAAIAQSKLHGHVFKGYFLTTAIKARLDATTRLGHAFGGRLIIRNLHFAITEQDLRYLFAPFGPVHSIDIPTVVQDGKAKSRGRGFAFVWMLSEADAGRAIEGLNGKKVYAGIALEAIKEETDGEKKSAKRKRDKAAENSNDRGRVIAVDWALSKKKFEEAGEAEDQGTSKNAALSTKADGDESASGTDGDSDEEPGEDGSDDELDASDDSNPESIASLDEQDDEDEDAEEATASQNTGTTLFVRNLSFEATEDELHTLFRPFGPLRYARIVMDPKLGRSRGTGFVCLWNKEDAQKVLELAEKLESEGIGHGPLAANGMPSLLKPDPSSSLAAQLSLHGRVLGVSEAVSREQAEKLRVDRDKSGEGKDKRHLYLMRQGVIFPNSHEAKGLHPADLSARQQSFDQRKALLRSNLSLYISHTRLSIRQLPLYVSERCLKRLARHALDEWRKEVKAGKRAELSTEELERAGCAKQTLIQKADRRAKKAIQSKVKQAKILRTNDKVDFVSGLGKSKGYGFLEMENHQDALRVLRWANANPVVDRLLKVWTCEELEKTINRQETELSKGSIKDKKPAKEEKEDDAPVDARRLEKLKSKMDELRAEVEGLDRKHKKAGAVAHASATTDETTGSHIKPHRMLIIEFAIENAQTVKKRLEMKEKSREKFKRGMVRNATEPEASQPTATGSSTLKRKGRDQPGTKTKRHKISAPNEGTSAPKKAHNNNNKLGRIIGKKRNQKKQKGR